MHCSRRRVIRAVFASIVLGALCAPAMGEPVGDSKSVKAIPDLGVLWAKSEDEYFKAPKNGPVPRSVFRSSRASNTRPITETRFSSHGWRSASRNMRKGTGPV